MRQVLRDHDGGVLDVVAERLHVKCPHIKWGCDPTWRPTFQQCNQSFLGRITWKVLQEFANTTGDDTVHRVLLAYFRALERHCGFTHFGADPANARARTADEAAMAIWNLVAWRGVVQQQDIKLEVPLMSLLHFSRKDLYRCAVYRDKLRGLCTGGGRLVHLSLNVPELPWMGRSEVQKTALKYREAGVVSRECRPFVADQAEARIAVLRAVLARQMQVPFVAVEQLDKPTVPERYLCFGVT